MRRTLTLSSMVFLYCCNAEALGEKAEAQDYHHHTLEVSSQFFSFCISTLTYPCHVSHLLPSCPVIAPMLILVCCCVCPGGLQSAKQELTAVRVTLTEEEQKNAVLTAQVSLHPNFHQSIRHIQTKECETDVLKHTDLLVPPYLSGSGSKKSARTVSVALAV